MPEGPEVKTVARTLAKEIVGKELGSLWHSHHRLRREVNYQALRQHENMVVDDVSCYGKVLFIHINQRPAVVFQLGMTGQLTVTSVEKPVASHTHIRWRLKNTSNEIRYVDPRRFGLIDACDNEKKIAIIKKLGPDPLSMSLRDHYPLVDAMKRSSRAIKDVLLDQSIIAGVGNIYASEALFIAMIDPKRRASDLSDLEYRKLIEAVTAVLHLAYENCGTTFSNYVDGSGKKGDNLQFLKVFQREQEPCILCKSLILRIKQAGRSTFYCAKCQK